MRTTFALLTTLLAATGTFAAPAPLPQGPNQPVSTATIAFANDNSGANAPVSVPLDGASVSLSAALGNGPLYDAATGQILASSAQLTSFPQGTQCYVTSASGSVVASLTDERTYFDLDGNPNAVAPIDLAGGSVSCQY